MERLTDRCVKSLTPRGSAYEVREGDGFGVRVLPSGSKTWFYTCESPTLRRRRRMSLGIYPTVTLSEARRKYGKASKAVEERRDPLEERQQDNAGAIAAPTAGRLVGEYIEKWAKPRKRPGPVTSDSSIRTRCLPGVTARRSITRRDVRLLIEEKAEKAPIAASRLLAVVRRMFNWAMEQAVLEHSPATRIKAPAKENSKERVLSPMEIRSFWNATDGATAEIPRALKLVLATGQRPGEVMGARWEEFDLEGGWWTIPGERAKNGRRTVKRTASPSRPWP